MTRCDTKSMNFFLEKLSEQFSNDYILLICDGAVAPEYQERFEQLAVEAIDYYRD